jgi:hypothetical protein
MTKSIFLLFLSIAASLNAYSQEPKRAPLQDSSAARMQTLDAGSFYPYRQLLFPPPLDTDLQAFPGFLRQSLALPTPSLSLKSQENLSIASAWKNDVLKQQENKVLKTILGSIQTGAAAYLVYKHVKKYGLK